MFKNYYYLAAVLPHLKFGEKPPLNTQEFLSECAKWLSPAELERLKTADIKEWKSFDGYLRHELARARKARKESNRIKPTPAVNKIMGEETPLLAEERWLKIRWNFLEEMELGHYFHINMLVSYYLKLQILERLARFDEKRGREAFEALSEAAYE